LFADLGGDVVFRDPHALREIGPFDKDGRSVIAELALANKKSFAASITVDELRALLSAADVVINDALPGTEARIHLDSLVSDFAHVVYVSITPHGLSGARSHQPGNDLTASARSGWASVNGLSKKSPLKQTGYQASFQAGTTAFAGAVSALIFKNKNGMGQSIDVGLDDASVMCFAPGILRSVYNNYPVKRRRSIDMTSGPVPVKDGHFALTITRPHFWQGAMKLLGLKDLAEEPSLQSTANRNANKNLFLRRVETAMQSWTKSDLFQELSRIPVVAGPVLTMGELAKNSHLKARKYFLKKGGVTYTGAPFLLSDTPPTLRAPAPEAITDIKEILELWNESSSNAEIRCEQSVKSTQGNDGPLSGYRGVVLTQAWSGAFSTELTALFGAEVIQVEARSRYDSWRGGGFTIPVPDGVKDSLTEQHSWNCDSRFNSVNLNKKSVTLELDTKEGRDVFMQLVAKADFVAENFSPRVMKKLGLDYESLKNIKPDIIYMSISGYGHSGPWSPLPAIGGTIEPTSGMSALMGYVDGEPMNSGQMYPDAVAGLCGFAGLTAALFHREKSGRGQHIDVSMQEANLCFIAERWLEYILLGQEPRPIGNRHPYFSPHGIFPAAGKDRWIAIACETEDQWRTLCEIAKRPDWRIHFGDRKSRKIHETDLEKEIANWTRNIERDHLTDSLLLRGVIAAPVLDGIEVSKDPVFRSRNTIAKTAHPEAGQWWQAVIPCLFSKTPARLRNAAPIKGANTAEILERLLNIGWNDYERLERAGITGVTAPKGKA